MTTISKALTKGTFATVAAGAMVMAAVTPAAAQDRNRDRNRGDGISAGEVIAGAVILGGIAAVIASSNNNDRDRYDDRDYRDDRDDRDYRNDRDDRDYRDGRGGYNNGYGQNGGYNARTAVDQCVRAAERQAQRGSGVNAEVYEVVDIDRSRRGFEISGRIAVRNDYRGRGWGGDYRRNYRNTGWDEGRFTCEYRNGRVTDIDFSGLRNL